MYISGQAYSKSRKRRYLFLKLISNFAGGNSSVPSSARKFNASYLGKYLKVFLPLTVYRSFVSSVSSPSHSFSLGYSWLSAPIQCARTSLVVSLSQTTLNLTADPTLPSWVYRPHFIDLSDVCRQDPTEGLHSALRYCSLLDYICGTGHLSAPFDEI
jgi:hypothetical protein